MKAAGPEKSGNTRMHWILLVSEILKDNFYKGLCHVARRKFLCLPAGTEVIAVQVVLLSGGLY